MKAETRSERNARVRRLVAMGLYDEMRGIPEVVDRLLDEIAAARDEEQIRQAHNAETRARWIRAQDGWGR